MPWVEQRRAGRQRQQVEKRPEEKAKSRDWEAGGGRSKLKSCAGELGGSRGIKGQKLGVSREQGEVAE